MNSFRRWPEWLWNNEVDYSTDGRYVVWFREEMDGEGGSLYFGESLYPAETCKVGYGGCLSTLLMSPDGSVLGYADDVGTLELWDSKTEEPLPISCKPIRESRWIAITPDGCCLAAVIDNTVFVHKFDSGELIRTFENNQPISSAVFSSDGQYLATASELGVGIWNYEAGSLVQGLEVGTGAGKAVLSPDSQYIVCDTVRGVTLWQIEQGVCLWSQQSYKGRIECLSFSPNSDQLIGLDSGGDVYRWRLDGKGQLISTAMLSKDGWKLIEMNL